MSFLKNLGNNLTIKSKELVQKAKDISETSSLNTIIKNEEFNIETQYKLIGRQYFEKYLDHKDNEFSASMNLIKKSMDKIETTKLQIETIKKKSCCPSCGTSFKKGAIFCSICGIALPKPAESEKDASDEKCPKCGNNIENGALFCCSCGYKITQSSAACSNEDASINKTVPLTKKETLKHPNECSNSDTIEDNSTIESKKCPKCSAIVKYDDLFCDECGTKL